MTSDGIPQLHFDQLNGIAHHLHAIKMGEDQWKQSENIRCTVETTTPTHGPHSFSRSNCRGRNKRTGHTQPVKKQVERYQEVAQMAKTRIGTTD